MGSMNTHISQKEHTVSEFDDELSKIGTAVNEMGKLACNQLGAALELLRSYDKEEARRIILADDQVDALEHQIDDLAIQLLMRRQPLASDLRYIVTVPKLCSSLERIADVACNIARRSKIFANADIAEEAEDIIRLGGLAQSMVQDVIRAFQTRDSALAKAVHDKDDELDAAYADQFARRLASAAKAQDETAMIIPLMFMAKNIERAGDHATNLAESVYYIIRGEALLEKHRRHVAEGL